MTAIQAKTLRTFTTNILFNELISKNHLIRFQIS